MAKNFARKRKLSVQIRRGVLIIVASVLVFDVAKTGAMKLLAYIKLPITHTMRWDGLRRCAIR